MIGIIDNTKWRPAKFVRKPKPSFKTNVEKLRYWEKEFKIWNDGYSEDINGMHYFHMTQGWIPDARGVPIRPIWREADETVFKKLEHAFFKRKEDAFVMKRREFGLSSIGAGCLPIYFAQILPGAKMFQTSCDLDRVSKMFKEKTITYWKNLDPHIALKKEQLQQTTQKSYLEFSQQVVDPENDEETRTIISSISCPETVKDPKAPSSGRYIYAFIDEIALHPKRKDVLKSLYPAVSEGESRSGYVLLGGTIEEGISQENLNAIREMVESSRSDSGDTTIIFIPAPAGMQVYDDIDPVTGNKTRLNIPGTENGWDNVEFVTELILRKRERLDLRADKTFLQAYIKNYPLNLDEVLESAGKGKLPPEIIIKSNARQKEVRAMNLPLFRYDLDYNAYGEVTAYKNSKGNFHIFEMPKLEDANIIKHPYIAGNDPIPYGDADVDDGSDDAMAIKRRLSQTYVAYMSLRVMDPHYVFQQKKLLQTFYGQCQSMLEMNRGETMFNCYKDTDSLHLLAKKPMNLGIKYETSRTYGWYKNKTAALANSTFITFLYNHVDKQVFPAIFSQLEQYLIQNTDIADAMVGCELFDADLRKGQEAKSKKEQAKISYVRVLERGPDNKIYYVNKEQSYRG